MFPTLKLNVSFDDPIELVLNESMMMQCIELYKIFMYKMENRERLIINSTIRERNAAKAQVEELKVEADSLGDSGNSKEPSKYQDRVELMR